MYLTCLDEIKLNGGTSSFALTRFKMADGLLKLCGGKKVSLGNRVAY